MQSGRYALSFDEVGNYYDELRELATSLREELAIDAEQQWYCYIRSDYIRRQSWSYTSYQPLRLSFWAAEKIKALRNIKLYVQWRMGELIYEEYRKQFLKNREMSIDEVIHSVVLLIKDSAALSCINQSLKSIKL